MKARDRERMIWRHVAAQLEAEVDQLFDQLDLPSQMSDRELTGWERAINRVAGQCWRKAGVL